MSRSRRAGFTLLELLIVLMILSIVAGIALPAMASTARAMRLSTARSAFIGDLGLARTEAIRRNKSVEVVKTSATTYTIEYIGARTLEDGVAFASGPTTVRFAAFGPVQTGAATYTLDLNGETITITLSTAGMARAQ